MSLADLPTSPPPGRNDSSQFVGPSPQERAWLAAEGVAVAVMGTVNASVARLVDAVCELLAVDGWVGHGIRSPEHWLMFRAGLSHGRTAGLVRIARRVHALPECFALFVEGRLGEDAMVRIARRVPASRDAEIAGLAPRLSIPQLDRLLRSLPELPDGTHVRPTPERMVQVRDGDDGWVHGRFCLPADEGALVRLGLTSARDAEFHDRNPHDNTNGDGEGGGHGHDGACGCDGVRRVDWADALVRMASEAADALDPTLARSGTRGERNMVVVHRDLGADGRLGPAQLDLGPTVPDSVAEYLSCDAHIQVVTTRVGELLGIHPTERVVNRAMRRYLHRRDQGCIHPTCGQRMWLHAHHVRFWEHGGLTVAENLVLLCPFHHRALHMGEYSIEGNPEAGTVRFLDRVGHEIIEPGPEPSGEPPPDPPPATNLRHRRSASASPPDTFAWN